MVETNSAPVSAGIRATGEPRVSLSNPFLTVNDHPVAFPYGGEGVYSVVTAGTGLGSVVIPTLTFRGHEYLGLATVARFPFGGALSLEFPRGGTDDLGEAGAARELFEETGLAGSLRQIGLIRPDTGLMDTEVAVWMARVSIPDFNPSTAHELAPDTDGEIQGLTWHSHGHMQGLIKNGKLLCGMTIAAYALYRL